MNRVSIALAVALAGALVVIAHLLGQRSVSPLPSPQPPAPTQIVREIIKEHVPPAPADAEEAYVPPTRVQQSPPSEAPPPEDLGDGLAIERRGSEVRIVNARPGQKSADAERLASYLDQVKALQVGPAGASQESFAQELLGEAMSGDVSGLNNLIRQTEAAQQQVKDLRPPPGAEQHKAKLLDLLGESAKLLAAERDALQRKDPQALTLLVTNARDLQAKAKALEAEQAALAQKIK